MHIRRPDTMLVQASVILLLFAGLMFWQSEILMEVYFGPLATELGQIINGVIVALFLLALSRIIILLIWYRQEDCATNEFEAQLDLGLTEAGIENLSKSLIVQRYRTMQQEKSEQEIPPLIALASLLASQEMARLGLVRLIQSLLILLGVFGTVASLSIALVGASDLLVFSQAGGGIGSVVRGMATALSTTMTAIAAYLTLTLVFSRLAISQSSVCQHIELLTLRRLVPLAARGAGSPELRLKNIGEVATSLAETQAVLAAQVETLARVQTSQDENNKQLLDGLQMVTQTLKQGFRLD